MSGVIPPLHENFDDVVFDYFFGTCVVQYWNRETPWPQAGIIRFKKKWYVWPPILFQRHAKNFPEEFLAFVQSNKHYTSRHAAATACRLLYEE